MSIRVDNGSLGLAMMNWNYLLLCLLVTAFKNCWV